MMRNLFRLGDDLGDMQQRLGRYAAYIQAHTAQTGEFFHQHHLLAQICRTERGGIAAGTGAENQYFCMYIPFFE